jgi:2-keto-4-pentenoate hydratase/2-oxohepta-3-ene-1,7-dioic acid hydratase in catechol pathway
MVDADGRIRDLSHKISDIGPNSLRSEVLTALSEIDPYSLPELDENIRLGSCVGGVGKVVCIGLNYIDHAREAELPEPKEPIVFLKATTALCGPNDSIRIAPDWAKTDWEIELGVVIGTPARFVQKGDALQHVAGYCIANDVSERHLQLERSGQWTKGKSADTFCPLGPWLVTRDEISDPSALELNLWLNGKLKQSSSTSNMVFDVGYLVSFLSHFMTLMPGDVICTGTPAGVGMGQKPPQFLSVGDRLRLKIAGLGQQDCNVESVNVNC